MSLNHFVKNGRNKGNTDSYMELQVKGVDTKYLNVFENLNVFSTDKSQNIDFVYEDKGNAGDFFINSDGSRCAFSSKETLLPEIQNINKDETIENLTSINGDLVVDNLILRNENINLKQYIDEQIAIVYASLGGTINKLTEGGG
jgi:hypothetical protein